MQQITRGDYLKDLITIYIENNLQTDITELYNQFIFQCGEIQKVLTPAQVIKISFDEIESQLLKSTNTCYLAGITTDGHKETFNGSLTFNTRGEVVYYEPPVSTVIPAATETNCDCHGLRGFFSNCSQPAIKAYFSINYVPTKLSELENDTDFQDGLQVAESISIHNASTEAHPYIQGLISDEASVRASETEALGIRIDEEVSVRASQTEALSISIGAETTAREQAISLAISTTEGYADTLVSSATTAINTTIGDLSELDTSVKSSVTNAINAEVATRLSADNNLQGQIDGLAAASDVTDIVGTYAELQAYDTQHLNDNDIIKVLSDETHDDEPSYYRFNKTAGTFSYIGSESAAYTKAQSDSIFVTQTTEINGHALSNDINLTPSDIGALADSYATVISANTSAIASNTSVIAQHTTAIAGNTSDISTVNGKIPTDASTTNKLVSAASLAASIADFANKDLNNLSTTGTQKLRSLNAYTNNGELLTDADGLAFVDKYAHSTFDLSKFTVVGSPVITDDGIASGFSTSSYLTYAQPSYSTSLEIYFAIIPDGNGKVDGILGNFESTPNRSIQLDNNNITNKTFRLWLSSDGINYDICSAKSGTATNLTINVLNYFRLTWNGTTYKLQHSLDLQNWSDVITQDSTLKINTSYPWIIGGTVKSDRLYGFTINGSIDLKQFSITVDGVPVFSGNKTGIDTIKPDDYTVVGSPNITDDGIIHYSKGNSTSNIYSNLTIATLANKSWFSEGVYDIPVLGTGVQTRFGNDAVNLNGGFQLNYRSDGYIIVKGYAKTGDSNDNALKTFADIILKTPSQTLNYTKVYIKYQFDITTGVYSIYYKYNFSDSYTLGASVTATTTNKQLYFINTDATRPLVNFVCDNQANSIDLNAFKIYVDGDLIYQPCLKIPFTLSKTGAKIVDSIYRDRVADMAEQFGFAPYYTLSNTDFTLPQVELYGLIGQRTLRDSYRNGINYWELYSNRDLEQGGSCTSGVEVTFARPFADTNYVLSVPYSAKSATAFTPTQTGDWIAKGKGIL